jgi:hypothetical protein
MGDIGSENEPDGMRIDRCRWASMAGNSRHDPPSMNITEAPMTADRPALNIIGAFSFRQER